MRRAKSYPAIDYARLAATFLVVAIHVAPLAALPVLDTCITYGLGRAAVPFFFMVTGYFVLSGYEKENYWQKLGGFLKKMLLLYLGATVLYLPVSWYAGNLPTALFAEGKIFAGTAAVLKWFFMDGTFYHLWYFPAVIIGSLLVGGGLWFWNSNAKAGSISAGKKILCMAAVTVLLYIIGVFGDSWYGIIEKNPVLHSFYDGIFVVSAYTRNGIFFAPVFLLLGVFLKKYRVGEPGKWNWIAAGVSGILLVTESLLTWKFELWRHSSMYFSLLPLMLFLFQGLLSIRGKGGVWCRKISLWIYLLHPLCIVGIRGVAGVLSQEKIMVENTLVLYLEVCILSSAVAWLTDRMVSWTKEKTVSAISAAGEGNGE